MPIRDDHRPLPLFRQLTWFVRLRWGAGTVVILGALMDRFWLTWFPNPWRALAVGVGILACNAAFRVLVRPGRNRSQSAGLMVAVAWAQIVLDLIFLTLLTLWTGGTRSPLLGCYVFHMVIASMLLARAMAYIGAAMSGVMLMTGLWATSQLPVQRPDALVLVGWFVALLITVYLTGNVTRSVNRQRLRLLRQRQRIRSMSKEIRWQKKAMVQQDKMAAMGEMAAGVAHEIANPLACMDSLLQLIQRKPERLQDGTVEKLREQAGRISQIVRQLTHFAHPAEEKWEKVAIGDVIARSVQMVRFDPRFRDGKVLLTQRIGTEMGDVRVQSHALEQVLVNIILNALDAMADEAAPHLDIHAWRDKHACFIEIADNGRGILPEHMDRLFEPFFTTKPVGKGTGLGLAISYRLVRNHGGRLEAESHGKGAKFRISLPMADAVP
jgi:signal transduction histidine kinase